MEEARKDIGARLREAREYLGITQQEAADVLAVPRSAISLIETGQRRLESLELRRLAELYERSMSYFTGTDEPEPPKELQVLMRKAEALSEQDRKEILQFADFLLSRRERDS